MPAGVAMSVIGHSACPAAALDKRGFESLRAPEHSRVPVRRAAPWPQGGPLSQTRVGVAGPFAALSMAAAAAKPARPGGPPVPVGSGIPHGAGRAPAREDGRAPHAQGPACRLPGRPAGRRAMEAETGRAVPTTGFGGEDGPARRRAMDAEAGIARAVVSLPRAGAAAVPPRLDRRAARP